MRYLPLLLLACHPQPQDRTHDLTTCWRLYGPDSAPVNLVTQTDRPILRCLVEQYGWRVEDAEQAVLLKSRDYREKR